MIAVPFLLHWKAKGEVPVATTVSVAEALRPNDWPSGCVVMDGATPAGLTVKFAGALVTLPTELVISTV